MSEDRIHRAVSTDGTEVAGIVRGAGPPLVLLHAGVGDGELDWRAALPILQERFTCYAMSYRSRGWSGEASDLSPDRIVDDVAAFTESLGEPAGLVGLSGGGMFVLGAAARSEAVAAVAAVEPIVLEAVGADEGAALQEAFDRMDRTASEGRLVEAVQDWIRFFASESEMAALERRGYFEEGARNVPVFVDELKQAMAFEGPGPTDPWLLRRIEVPVVLLEGMETTLQWYRDGIRHVAEHAPRAEVRKVPGVGHFGAWVEPEPVVEALSAFFERELSPA